MNTQTFYAAPRSTAHIGVCTAAAAVALFVAGFAPVARAQGKPAPAAKTPAGKPGKPGKHMTPEQLAQRDLDRVQKMMGKPLTPAQKTALMSADLTHRAEQKASTDKFNAAVAKALGISVDELKKKFKATSDAEKAAMMAKMAALRPPPMASMPPKK